ncbi:MAG TPA: NAD(P)H-binding protein [Aggregatilineales bacterium]|nr:NAD(P)H-binding protein [Aggregatilineales bacterium]
MNITIFGASGRTGRLLVQAALNAGHSVTAFVRDPAKLPVQHMELKVVQGDTADAAAVARAVAGADAVISGLGPVKGSPKDLLVTAQQHIVAAMQAAGVKRYVLLTGAGVRDPQDQPKLIDKVFGFLLRLTAADVLKDSEDGVRLVQATALDWIVVRGPRLTDGPKTGRYRVGYVGQNSGTQISRADLADFMLEQAVNESDWIRKMPMISW